MKTILTLLLVILSAGWAHAQEAGGAAEPITPSRAVGSTHSCADYYPDEARVKEESGDVLVSYDVGTNGTIGNVRLLKSSGSDSLDRAALACVSEHWRNTPATRGGVPVASAGHEAIIRFTLHVAPSQPSLPPVDKGISNIVLIVIGVFLAGVLALGVFLFAKRRRR